MMVEVLSGFLSGTGAGLWQQYSPHWQQGQWFMAVRIDAFTDPVTFKADLRRLVDEIHAIPPAADAAAGAQVGVPGDRGGATRARRAVAGIPLDAAIIAACTRLADECGVPFPAAITPPGPS